MPNKQFEPYEYAPTEVLHGYAQWAMRAAVFGPLFSREVFAVQDVPQMLTDVRKRWHSRLLSLHEEGWARVSTARKLRYCMNCPPFGVKTGTSANCCLFVRFCPFCWARKVPSLYYDRLLLAKDRITNLKLEGVTVVEFRRTFTWKRPSRMAWRRKIITRMQRERVDEVSCTEKVLGYGLVQTLNLSEENMIFNRRGVMFLPAGGSFRPIDKEGLKWTTHTDWDVLKNLGVMTGRVCRYPARLLDVPSVDLLLMLDKMGKRRVKTISYSGLMR